MTSDNTVTGRRAATTGEGAPDGRTRATSRSSLLGLLSFRRIGALYVLLVVCCIFAVWIPDLFLKSDTAQQVANQSAVQGIVALSLLIPLAAGVFDLSVAATV